MPHITTIQRRLDNVTAAIASRTWLNTTYQSRDDNGNTVTIARRILPFKVYRSRDGQLVMDGFDTHRQSVRTFRLDRFKQIKRGEQHEGDDPAVLHTRGGEITVYPAAWTLVQARPQTISAKALDKFLANGWSTQPFAGVIQPVQ